MLSISIKSSIREDIFVAEDAVEGGAADAELAGCAFTFGPSKLIELGHGCRKL